MIIFFHITAPLFESVDVLMVIALLSTRRWRPALNFGDCAPSSLAAESLTVQRVRASNSVTLLRSLVTEARRRCTPLLDTRVHHLESCCLLSSPIFMLLLMCFSCFISSEHLSLTFRSRIFCQFLWDFFFLFYTPASVCHFIFTARSSSCAILTHFPFFL